MLLRTYLFALSQVHTYIRLCSRWVVNCKRMHCTPQNLLCTTYYSPRRGLGVVFEKISPSYGHSRLFFRCPTCYGVSSMLFPLDACQQLVHRISLAQALKDNVNERRVPHVADLKPDVIPISFDFEVTLQQP